MTFQQLKQTSRRIFFFFCTNKNSLNQVFDTNNTTKYCFKNIQYHDKIKFLKDIDDLCLIEGLDIMPEQNLK